MFILFNPKFLVLFFCIFLQDYKGVNSSDNFTTDEKETKSCDKNWPQIKIRSEDHLKLSGQFAFNSFLRQETAQKWDRMGGTIKLFRVRNSVLNKLFNLWIRTKINRNFKNIFKMAERSEAKNAKLRFASIV